MELELPPMFPLGFAFVRVSVGSGNHHAIEGGIALLVAECRHERSDQEQSGEERDHCEK